MIHRATYRIDSFPGCEGAALQATGNSDRPLCAFVSAWTCAAFAPLTGTLSGSTDEERSQWFRDECARHQIAPTRVVGWGMSISGRKNIFTPRKTTYAGVVLDAYQIEALRALTGSGGALGLFMGAGKTACGTACAYEWGTDLRTVHPKRCWIFCPLNAMPAWERVKPELEEVYTEVKIISVDSAHKYIGCADIGGFLIVDEAHMLGEATARRTKAMHTIRSKFDFCLCLTGTLVNAGVEKTLSIADLCVPGMALFSNRWKAGEHFACLVRKSIGPRTVTALEKPTTKLPQFHAWLARWAYLLKPDSPEVRAAFQLPEQHIHEIRLGEPWPSFDTEVANAARAAMEADPEGKIPHAQEIAHLLARAHAQEKIDWLVGELESDPTEPAVVFAQYRESLDLLCAALGEAGVSFVRVDGDCVGADRAERERQFQAGDVRVFVGQIHAASVSMNLQRAKFSATIDVSWSPIDYPQALARTCRRGQTHECVHLDIVANRTQSMILARLRKAEAFSAECSTWQEMKRILKEMPCPMPTP